MRSTLSIAFILCVISVIVMIFMQIEPGVVTFGVITAVTSAYMTNYGNTKEGKTKEVKPDEPAEDLSLSKLEAYDTSNQQ